MRIKKSVEIPRQDSSMPLSAPEVEQGSGDNISEQPPQQQQENPSVLWQSGGLNWQETITAAEAFAVETVGRPLTALGVTVFLYNLYDSAAPRPNEYVIIIPDTALTSTSTADDAIDARESRIEFVVQGKGKTYDNFVLEISLKTVELLEAEWKSRGNVYQINNADYGYDAETDITSRVVSCVYRY